MALAGTVMLCPAQAVEVHAVQVAHEGSRYRVTMQVTLDAPASASWRVFSDPMRLPQINPAVREVRVLERAGTAQPQVYTLVEVCVSLYCRRIEQVQQMQFVAQGPGGTVTADVLPALSDFRFGHARWSFADCQQRTCLQFEAELEPAFWVPPLIGPWLIERKLRAEALETSQGLERLARKAESHLPP